MAVHAPIMGAPLRASSIDRRSLIAALAATPALASGTVAIAAVPTSAAAPSNRHWDALHAAFNKASEIADRYWRAVYQPLRMQLESYAGDQPPLWFESIARNGHVARMPVNLDGSDMEAIWMSPKLRREAQAAIDAYKSWQERIWENERNPRWNAVRDRMDALWVVEDRSRAALMLEPAPDAAALSVKVQLAMGNDEIWDADRTALLADANRLTGDS